MTTKHSRIASKLGRSDILSWLTAELNGYGEEQELPDYRVVKSVIALSTNGFVATGFGDPMKGMQDLPGLGFIDFGIREPISNIITIAEGSKNSSGGHIVYSTEHNKHASSLVHSHFNVEMLLKHQIHFVLHLNTTQVISIHERIKDKVLEWACALENDGVIGEDTSFSDEEVKTAVTTTFSLNHCNVEQLNAHGENHKA